MGTTRVAVFTIAVLLFSAALLTSGGITLAEDVAIGFVKKVETPAFVIRGESRQPANIGHPVFMNDLLKTGESGAMGVTFKDNTMISIGPNTEFIVDEFVYRPREKALSFSSRMTRGTLNFVSGTIAKLAPESVSVKTPAGTIGIRGTRFLVRVEEDEE